MLVITSKGLDFQWHFGEPLPMFRDRVITFQADGDELLLILRALAASRQGKG